VEYFAAANSSSAISQGATLLLISVPLIAIGALLAFDLFGFVSKNRVPPTSRSREFRERLGLPDTHKLVGGTFLIVGILVFIFAVIGELIRLAR
jgi:hypothetical protein